MKRFFCVISGIIILVSSLLGIFVPIMGIEISLSGWINIFGSFNRYKILVVGDLDVFRFDMVNFTYGFIPGVCIIIGAILLIISKKEICFYGYGLIIFGFLVEFVMILNMNLWSSSTSHIGIGGIIVILSCLIGLIGALYKPKKNDRKLI